MSTKHTILESACNLFLEEGPAGFSMRKVANRADISATAIYRHYKDKEELHNALIRFGFKTYANLQQRALEGETSRERFDLAAEAAFEFAMRHSRFYQLVFLSPDTNERLANNADLRREAKRTFNFLSDRINECMDEGIFKRDDPGECSAMFLATCNGFFSLHFSGLLPRSNAALKALYFRTVNRMLDGLLTN